MERIKHRKEDSNKAIDASGRKIEKAIRGLAKETGQVIPKPQAKADFVIKGIGMRRGEEALIYRIPSHSKKTPFYEKGVTFPEFLLAYSQLKESGYFTRAWFNKSLSACAKEGACNFTTIGGVFSILDMAEYTSRATYQLKA